jgi:Ca2+-binding EF-hand superfamily protein
MSQQYNVPPEVLAWFQAVDQDRSGRISSAELQKALLNANNREFRYDSVRLLFNMVDKSRVGMIDVNQFGTLITFINDWRSKFDRFDVARTGAINGNNLAEVFRSLGFQLSPTFCATVIRMWGSRTRPGALEFDGFLAVVVLVRTFTDKFAAKDAQHNGNARISYEEFLAMVFDSELV